MTNPLKPVMPENQARLMGLELYLDKNLSNHEIGARLGYPIKAVASWRRDDLWELRRYEKIIGINDQALVRAGFRPETERAGWLRATTLIRKRLTAIVEDESTNARDIPGLLTSLEKLYQWQQEMLLRLPGGVEKQAVERQLLLYRQRLTGEAEASPETDLQCKASPAG